MRIIIYRTTGECDIMHLTEFPQLETLQKIVGGYIELVRLPDGTDIYANEEGLLNSLPPNPYLWFNDGIDGSMNIVGDAIHFKGCDDDGNSLGFDDVGPLPMREAAKSIVAMNANARGEDGDEAVRKMESRLCQM
jgi:hypothetical protein